MGAQHGDTAANHMDLLYLRSRRGRKNYIRHPDVVKRIGSYLRPEFPLFHVLRPFYDNHDKQIRLLLMNPLNQIDISTNTNSPSANTIL